MEHHKKRLQEIAKRSNRTSTKEEELVRFAKNKQAIHLIEQANRQTEIERLNQKLLKKLVEISTSGKPNVSAHPVSGSNAA